MDYQHKTLWSTSFFVASVIIVNTANSQTQSLATDPFVKQAIQASNFEPGGQFFSNGLCNGGHIISGTKSYNIRVVVQSSVRAGTFQIEQGLIIGNYSYAQDRPTYHPWQEHGPFTASATVTQNVETSTKDKAVNLSITSSILKIHPEDAYDGPSGGGFPPPGALQAHDSFYITVNGTARGNYWVPANQRNYGNDKPRGLGNFVIYGNYVGQNWNSGTVIPDSGIVYTYKKPVDSLDAIAKEHDINMYNATTISNDPYIQQMNIVRAHRRMVEQLYILDSDPKRWLLPAPIPKRASDEIKTVKFGMETELNNQQNKLNQMGMKTIENAINKYQAEGLDNVQKAHALEGSRIKPSDYSNALKEYSINAEYIRIDQAVE